MSQDPDNFNLESAVVDAARQFKKHLVAEAAKAMGTHDPELPSEDASAYQAGVACLSLFRALTVLDGPIAHEQPVLADMDQQLGEIKEDLESGEL